MGIIVNQQDNRTELQKKIAAELTEKAKNKPPTGGDMPDGVEDSAYIQGTRHTSRLAWVWVLVIAVLIIGVVIYFVMGGNK